MGKHWTGSVLLALLAACSGNSATAGNADSGTASLDCSKPSVSNMKLGELTDEELLRLCDFSNCPQGYGGKIVAECDGSTRTTQGTRDGCLKKKPKATCTATVADAVACIEAQDLNPCSETWAECQPLRAASCQ